MVLTLEAALRRIAFFCLFLFCAVYFFRSIETDDIWWHLSSGRYIWEHHHLPSQDPFPYADEKTPWVFAHWLGSLIYFLIYLSGGEVGLQIFRSIYYLLIITGLALYARKKIPSSIFIALCFVSLFGLSFRA